MLKHVHATCAVLQSSSDFGQLKSGGHSILLGLQNDLALAKEWVFSGNPTFISALGVDLTKRAGFGAGRGVSKREASAYFAALVAAIVRGDDQPLELFRTFCIGTRSKEVKLVTPTSVYHEDQQVVLAGRRG